MPQLREALTSARIALRHVMPAKATITQRRHHDDAVRKLAAALALLPLPEDGREIGSRRP